MSSEPRGPARSGPVTSGQVLEIACDESGYEGEKLVGGTTDVFAHASVTLEVDAAAGCIEELRRRIRSPATEYKANHVLREKHRPVLIWLLGASGPLLGQAHVFLLDKAFFLVRQLVAGLVETSRRAAGMDVVERSESPAAVLYRAGRGMVAGDEWMTFLQSGNDLLRAKEHPAAMVSFFDSVDRLSPGGAGGAGRVGEVLASLRRARPVADSLRAQLLDGSRILPPLDPLIPALVRAVDRWSNDSNVISIVHDRQNTLSRERITGVTELINEPHRAEVRRGRLAGLTLVEAGLDPRIQVADFLAGVTRKVASELLNGREDAEIAALLRPYLDPASIWADDRTWSKLMP